jgi:heme-degrading monooxygenase HmoA
LPVLVERGIIVRRAARLSAGKVWLMFPAMNVKFEIAKWKLSNGDFFAEFEKWSPIYMIDPGFIGSKILREPNVALTKMKEVKSLSDWFQKASLARGQKSNAKGKSRIPREIPDGIKIEQFLKQVKWS